MGLFDFWKRRREGPERAGLLSSPAQGDKNRYLASTAGSKGLMALRVSGFDLLTDAQHPLVHARFIGRRGPDGKIEFRQATAVQARAWALSVNALDKVAGPFRKTVLKSGGTIVVSADVNVQSDAGFMGRVRALIDSLVQRYFTRGTKVENAIDTVEQKLRAPEMGEEDRVIPAYSMGNLFQGRYHGKDPQTGRMTLFNEQSFAVEIRGVDSEVLDAVADSIRTTFNQYAVLVINDNEGQVYLIEQDQQKEAPAQG